MMHRTLFILVWVLPLCFSLSGCGEKDPVLKDIREQGRLVVLTRNAPSTYYLGPDDNPAGFEYELSKNLADSLNVKVEYKLYDNIDEIFRAIENNEGHLAAAGLTRTELRSESYQFGPAYKTIQQQVVCHRQARLPENVDDLKNHSLLIIAESSYQELLDELRKNHPEISWETTTELSTEQVLEEVANREIDCTVADSNIVALNRRYYPDLVVAFALSEPEQLAWLLPSNSNDFKHYINDWFEKIEDNSTLDIIDERYYGYADIFDFYDNHIFLKRIEKRLPKYQDYFRRIADYYQLPWTLLAAQAYQESGWNPEARSPTGVKGLMMLTRNTAKAMGVENRRDPLQSIRGGARYLDRMLSRLPEGINADDRLWFALAAYNVGFAHLQDARQLAVKLGKNPNVWNDIKQVLPLLSQKAYYKDLEHGYARGTEPVRYIDRIRYYQDVLTNTLKSS